MTALSHPGEHGRDGELTRVNMPRARVRSCCRWPRSERDGRGQSDGDDGPIGDGMAEKAPPSAAVVQSIVATAGRTVAPLRSTATKTAPICKGMARVQSPLTMGMAVTMATTTASAQGIGPIGLGEIELNEAGQSVLVVRHDNSRGRELWRHV